MIVCGFEAYEPLKKRFPKRQIEPTAYAPGTSFYWFDRFGGIRMMHIGDNRIWVCDHERGFPFMMVRRVLRK